MHQRTICWKQLCCWKCICTCTCCPLQGVLLLLLLLKRRLCWRLKRMWMLHGSQHLLHERRKLEPHL